MTVLARDAAGADTRGDDRKIYLCLFCLIENANFLSEWPIMCSSSSAGDGGGHKQLLPMLVNYTTSPSPAENTSSILLQCDRYKLPFRHFHCLKECKSECKCMHTHIVIW